MQVTWSFLSRQSLSATMISNGREDVEFTTVDGITLRGWLFPATQRGPAIIMTPGVSRDDQSPLREPPADSKSTVQHDQGDDCRRGR